MLTDLVDKRNMTHFEEIYRLKHSWENIWRRNINQKEQYQQLTFKYI